MTTDDKNVLDIKAGKPKRPRKNDGDGVPLPQDEPAPPASSIPRGVLYRAVGLAMNRSELSTLPRFPVLFKVVEPVAGVRNVVQVDEETGVCEYVNINHVVNTILNYVFGALHGLGGYAWEVRYARDCADQWKSLAAPIPEPAAVGWQGEDGLCFNRLPWGFAVDETGDLTPTFNGLFTRISNNSALIEWVGSLFDPKADRQQYVWLYGHGGDGKGALVRFLKRVLGHAFASKQAPRADDTHWTAGLIGKRLVVFPDSGAAGFPATPLFKSLTGGDAVDINPKHKDPYCAELFAKFMILSQEKPTISSEKADTRRVIYCAFEKGPEAFEHDFEEKLWAEGGLFLSTCIHNYRQAYPKHGPVKAETAEIAEWISVVEEDFEVAFERHLEVVAPPPPGAAPKAFVTPTQMQEVMKASGFDRRRQSMFMAWLERTHGVRKRAVALEVGTRKVYCGVRAKSTFERRAEEPGIGW